MFTDYDYEIVRKPVTYNNGIWHCDTVYDMTKVHIDQLTYKNLINRIAHDMSILPGIKNVIFNDPATIVFWEDHTKTVVMCDKEKYDPEKGFAMAITKKALGNKGNYYDVIKKWVGEDKLFPEKDKKKAAPKKKTSKK